jgi:hypothetical protein
MAVSDIFSTPFLICLGICFIIIGLVGFYFTQKIAEQNHKISSMVALVSTMAEEVNFLRARLQVVTMNGTATMVGGGGVPSVKKNIPDLIPVSDDESEEEDDDDDEEDDSENEEDEEEDEEEDDEDDEEKMTIEENIKINDIDAQGSIKVINIGESFNVNYEEELDNQIESEELSNGDDNDESSSDDELDELNEEEEGYTSKLPNINNIKEELDIGTFNSSLSFIDVGVDEDASKLLEEITTNSTDLLKTINISSLEETHNFDYVDYKKMSLPKLKSVVTEKNLVSDASKLKKNELLKLLGVE